MSTVVETTYGRVRGTQSGPVTVFKGIPFAAPPVGDLRFAAPAPPASWSGELDATDYGAISLQHLDPLSALIPGCEWNFYHPKARQAEDCLNLNVWAPSDAGEKLPVYVWIHGGAFLAGSGTGLWCDGTNMAASQGVVVVTVNYRLGALGGLAVDPAATTSNSMLRDQVAALTWVAQNIAAFGGDPARVIIGGESAGAMSVVALMTSPEARGLFHGAVVQSGHASFSSSPDFAAAVTKRYLTALGIDDAADPLAALRQVDVDRLLAAQGVLAAETVVPFRPIIDGQFHPAPLLDVFRAGQQAAVPLLIGTNSDEHNLFAVMAWGPGASSGDLRQQVAGLFDHDDSAVIDEVVSTYRSVEPTDTDAWNTMTTDRDWRGPVRDLASAHAASGHPVYSYNFTYRSTALGGRLRSAHALDIPFPFANLDQLGVSEFTGDDPAQEPVRQQTQQACVNAWGAFIRDARPAAPTLPEWPAYTADERHVLSLGAEPTVSGDPYGDRLDMWKRLQPTATVLGL